MNFIYLTKNRSASAKENIEVAVTMGHTNGRSNAPDVRISFNQAIKAKAFKNVDYLVCAYDPDCPDRIWFKDDNKIRGYKLYNANGLRYILTPTGLADLVDNAESFIGDYELLFDPVIQMWYIDRTKKSV